MDITTIEPLPHRRVQKEEESKQLWERLKSRWDVSGNYWFPLKDGDPAPNIMAFHTEFFDKMRGCELLHEILIKQGITEVFQLNEFGPPDYEIALSILEPRCPRLGEQYSTSEAADWVVYASHESSITIAGDWLAGFFREKWPDWTLRTYQGPYSTGNLRGTWDTG